MKEFVDRRFGEHGRGFFLYALGPIFFTGLLIYLVDLSYQTIVGGGKFDETLLILGGALLVAILLIVDSLAVYEARRVIQKVESDGNVIRLTPLWGRTFESSRDCILEIRATRSFGYIPGISVIDNNRPNIEIIFRDRPSVFLFGSCEADQWMRDLGF